MTLPSPGESITPIRAHDPRIPQGYRAAEPNPVLRRQFSECARRLARDLEPQADPTPSAS